MGAFAKMGIAKDVRDERVISRSVEWPLGTSPTVTVPTNLQTGRHRKSHRTVMNREGGFFCAAPAQHDVCRCFTGICSSDATAAPAQHEYSLPELCGLLWSQLLHHDSTKFPDGRALTFIALKIINILQWRQTTE